MKKSILIHNPRCLKSREALKILEERNIDFEVVDYLKDGLKEKMLASLPKLLGLNYSEMIRTKEDAYKELGLAGKNLSDKQWVSTLMKNPILLERPILIHENRAVIGRPTEKLLEIL